MDALLIVAALAAQTAPATGSPTPTSPGAPLRTSGESNYLDLEAGAGYSTNPSLSLVNNGGSAFGRISVHGVHSRVSARTTTLLSAYAEDVTYTNHRGSQQSINLYAHHDAAVTEHARLFADVSATYQEGGQLYTRVLGLPVIPPVTPGGTIVPPILVPPTSDFLSVTGREYSLSAHGGGTFALGAQDSMTLSSGIDHVIFRSGGERTSYTTIPVSLAYDHQLSARSTVGARVVAQDTEYDGPASFRMITPQLTGRTVLAERITLDGAIGVSFATIDNGVVTRHSTGLSASADLCGQGETSSFCAHVAADEQAATTAGPARSLSGGVDYTQRLDADQTVQFSLGATHYSAPTSVITGRTFSSSNFYHAAASYSRRFATRLFGGVNLAVRKLTQNGPDPKTDLNGSLFIRYRFGDVQ